MEHLLNTGYYDDNTIVINNLYYGELYAVPRVVYSYLQLNDSIMHRLNNVGIMVLNCQGCDLDIKLLASENRADILQRYAYDVIGLYANKQNLQRRLGDMRYHMYVSECRPIPDSITYKLLTWQQLDSQTQSDVRKVVLPLIKANRIASVCILLKALLNR